MTTEERAQRRARLHAELARIAAELQALDLEEATPPPPPTEIDERRLRSRLERKGFPLRGGGR